MAYFSRACPLLSMMGVLAVLAAGCANVDWHKPGVAQATLDEDLQHCRQDARQRSAWEALPDIVTSQVLGADPLSRPIVVQSHQREAERLLTEQNLTRSCMRGKGYELVPQKRE